MQPVCILILTTQAYNITVRPRMMTLQRTDEELMMDFQKGDVRAFEEIFKRHRHGVYNFIYRYLGGKETAEEVFQEVFTKLHRYADRYQPSGKFTTWLYTITRNQCVDTFRRNKIRRTWSLDKEMIEGESGTLGDHIEGNEISQDILASAKQIEDVLKLALANLNPDQREVFLMREKEGLKFEEIAKIVGVSVNTVKSRMRYALEGLRKIIRNSKYSELLENHEVRRP